MDNSFADRKHRVFSFIDEVNRRRALDKELSDAMNSPEVKLRKIQKAKSDGVNKCLNVILGKLYCKALPVDSVIPPTMSVNGSICTRVEPVQLQDQMADFINSRCDGKGPVFYIHEAIKRTNSPVLKELLEGCKKIVDEQYQGKEINPSTITDDDIEFKLSGESEEKLNDLAERLQMDDLSDVIKQNVKNNTLEEIEAARKEREERKNLEEELKNDTSVTTEEKVLESCMHMASLGPKVYHPSLFQGILIHKFNHLPYYESTVNSDYPITEVSPMMEGVASAVKNLFRGKADRETAEDFKTFEGSYKNMLGMYKSQVQSYNHDQIIKNCKMAIKSDKVSPTVVFSLIDMKESEKSLNETAESYKAVLRNPKENGGPTKSYSFPKKKYDLKEALKQYQASVKWLNTYFSDPKKAETQMKKYESIEGSATRLCTNGRELKRVRDALSGLMGVETTRVILHINFVKDVADCSKKIAQEASRSTVKEAAFIEAVKEYTMLNCIKALRLEDFPLSTVRKMADEYAGI